MPKKKTAAKTRTPLDEALRAAIRGSGKHYGELSLLAGLAPNAVARYMAGGRSDARLSTVEAICKVLGMEFTEPTMRGEPKPGKQGIYDPEKRTGVAKDSRP